MTIGIPYGKFKDFLFPSKGFLQVHKIKARKDRLCWLLESNQMLAFSSSQRMCHLLSCWQEITMLEELEKALWPTVPGLKQILHH